MTTLLTLSDAKARLSEVVHAVRTVGEDAVITVNGELAVRMVPIDAAPRRITPAEKAGFRALIDSLSRITRPEIPFDAVELLGTGRR